MTDKKMIIDDINVSELTSEQLVCMDRYSVAHLFIKLVEALSRTEDDYNKVQGDRVKMWADNTDLTEQLKRKEQEFRNICEAFDIEYVIDKETGSLIGRCNKLNKKEQECEKLKQALTEIKEIAEPFCNACQEFEPEKSKNCINCTYCNYNEILQKISEGLNDD